MDESPLIAIIIITLFIAAETGCWLKNLWKKWKLEQMKRQKVLGSTERHIDLRG
jgi:hypothetical protein